MGPLRSRRAAKASDWPFNGPAGPCANLGPGVYDPQRADVITLPNVSQSRASDLARVYAPMPFPAPKDAPASVWLRSLRSAVDAPDGPRAPAPAAGAAAAFAEAPARLGSAATGSWSPPRKLLARAAAAAPTPARGTSRGVAARGTRDWPPAAPPAAPRDVALRALRQHLARGGAALVSCADFKALLRAAGLKNSSVKPWLHGAAGSGSMGTHFEADDYSAPSFVCLGANGHLVSSPEYRPAPW
jgi:hypothetical protein